MAKVKKNISMPKPSETMKQVKQGMKVIRDALKPHGAHTGILEIIQERVEQIFKHKRLAKHDINFNPGGELKEGAAALLSDYLDDRKLRMPRVWNSGVVHGMIYKSYEDRLRIAGALIAAELDRLKNKRK